MERDDLVTDEGVDEGSAASTAEGAGTGGEPPVQGEGALEDETAPAPPDGTTSVEGRGQTLEAGEG